MTTLPNRLLPWPICWNAVVLIAEAEGNVLHSYRPLPNDRWTIGRGETDGVGPGQTWTQDYADQRFCDSLTERANAVRGACTLEPNENQLGALVSLAYNIGTGALLKSTVLDRHNRGNFEEAGRAFGLWNQSGGKVIPGLVARRAREAAMYLTPPAGAPTHAMPQTVDPESRPITGPIASSSTAVGGIGVVGAISAVGDQVSSVKGVVDTVKGFAVDTLGIPAEWIVPLLLIGLAAVILRARYSQRSGGHA